MARERRELPWVQGAKKNIKKLNIDGLRLTYEGR
jgi:hypothetical protein